MKKYVTYKRVSTQEQSTSGLGIEAQERSINNYVNEQSGTVVKAFQDLGVSGSKNDRPGLDAAIKYARKTKSALVVQKLDRLSRDMAFIVNFLKEVPFDVICSDSPNDDMFILHIKASVAQAERETISKRTKAGLESAKLRGVKLGGRQEGGNYYELTEEDKIKSAVAKREKAVARWIDWKEELQTVSSFINEKTMTYAQAAEWLTDQGMTSKNNKAITKGSLHRIMVMFKKEGIL